MDKHDANRTYGNLSPITSVEGHVRWVCLKHRNDNYLDKRQAGLVEELEKIGGEYEKETAAALVKAQRMTSNNVLTISNVINGGLNLYSLKLNQCEMTESSFDSLLAVIMNKSFIKVFRTSSRYSYNPGNKTTRHACL